RGIEEMEEGALGIDAGDDGGGWEFFAVGEDEADYRAAFYADVADFGVGANFGAGLAGGFGHRAGEGTETPVRKGSGAYGMRVGSGSQQKNGGRARGPRTHRGAKNSARGDNGTDKVGFKKFGDEIGGGHRSPAEEIEEAFFAETANAAAGLEKIPEILGRWRIDGRRRD